MTVIGFPTYTVLCIIVWNRPTFTVSGLLYHTVYSNSKNL